MKPTEEQIEAITAAMPCCTPSSSACSCNFKAAAREAWDIIAPMVLKEAARACDQDREYWEHYPGNAASACKSLAEHIRSLGKP